jgi:hypothetical protein
LTGVIHIQIFHLSCSHVSIRTILFLFSKPINGADGKSVSLSSIL